MKTGVLTTLEARLLIPAEVEVGLREFTCRVDNKADKWEQAASQLRAWVGSDVPTFKARIIIGEISRQWEV